MEYKLTTLRLMRILLLLRNGPASQCELALSPHPTFHMHTHNYSTYFMTPHLPPRHTCKGK